MSTEKQKVEDYTNQVKNTHDAIHKVVKDDQAFKDIVKHNEIVEIKSLA